MTSKMFTRQDAAMAASSASIPQEHAEKMIQMALGKYVTPSKTELKKKIITPGNYVSTRISQKPSANASHW
jgi:hypothetical protein